MKRNICDFRDASSKKPNFFYVVFDLGDIAVFGFCGWMGNILDCFSACLDWLGVAWLEGNDDK